MNNTLSKHFLNYAATLLEEERAEFLLTRGMECYRNQNYEATAVLCGAALDILMAKKSNDQLTNIQSAYSFLSFAFRRLERWDEAVRTSVAASNWLYQFSDADGNEAFKFAADCLVEARRYQEAIPIFESLLDDPLNVMSNCEAALLHFNLAVCNQGLKRFHESAVCYLRSKEAHFEMSEFEMVAIIEEELSLCFIELKQNDMALEYAQNALDYAILMNNRDRLEYSHNRMGLVRIALGEYDYALEHLEKAKYLLTTRETPDHELVFENEQAIATALEKRGSILEATKVRERIDHVWGVTEDLVQGNM